MVALRPQNPPYWETVTLRDMTVWPLNALVSFFNKRDVAIAAVALMSIGLAGCNSKPVSDAKLRISMIPTTDLCAGQRPHGRQASGPTHHRSAVSFSLHHSDEFEDSLARRPAWTLRLRRRQFDLRPSDAALLYAAREGRSRGHQERQL